MVRQVRLVIPGSKLTVSPGDTIRVDVEFTYQGPAWRETLYSSLYGYTFGMIDEVSGGAGSSAIDVPDCLQPTKITSYVLVPVPNRPGETFGIYAKLGNILSRYWDNVIEIAVVAPVQYTLEVTIEPPATGYVTKSPSKAKYSAGEVVTLTANPYSGYKFDHWGGWPAYPGMGSTSPSIQIAMTADWWVVAAFQEVTVPPPPPPPPPPPTQCPLSVSASPSSGGSVTRSPNKSLYDDGEMIDVTATANPGWSFDKFTGDGWETSANPVHVRGCSTTSVTAHFI